MADSYSVSNENNSSVSRIEVEELFGRYSYDLIVSSDRDEEGVRLMIIYGDNGGGKTTVLSVMFHLLSAHQGRGHRTFLAKVPFRRFSVTLSNGARLEAVREKGLVGSYLLRLVMEGKLLEYLFSTDDSFKHLSEGDGGVLLELYRNVEGMKIKLFFLRDDRVLESDQLEGPPDMDVTRLQAREFERMMGIRARREVLSVERSQSELKPIIFQFEQWVRKQALAGANMGVANLQPVYEEILTRIADQASPTSSPQYADVLVARLEKQAERSQRLGKFGLAQSVRVGRLVELIRGASESSRPMILGAVEPYIDGLARRIDALWQTQLLLEDFTDAINKFFVDKRISVDVVNGLTITTDDGHWIRPENLSSGERHLLLILCTAIVAREHATVFLIDEPEISLNIKWQRRLVRALLSCTKGSGVRFVLATHSIEVISQWRDCVVKLENQHPSIKPMSTESAGDSSDVGGEQ